MSRKRLVGIALIIVAILVVVGGGVFFLANQKNNPQANDNPTAGPTRTTTPQATTAATATAPSNLPANMLFDQEFNGSTVDPSLWNIVSKSSARGNGTQGSPFLSYYAPDDSFVSNGSLVLKAEQRSFNGQPYTTGAVTTAGKFAFTYGRVEIRAKLIQGQGLKAALWMLGAQCADFGQCAHWPAPGYDEIDNVEQVGLRPTNIYMTNHFLNAVGRPAAKQCVNHSSTAYWQAYHVFTVDWIPGQITWSIDGQPACVSTVSVPSHPMFLILNLTVGGPLAGSPGNNTPFPETMSIDYVRVYKNSSSVAFYGGGNVALSSEQPATPWWTQTADNVADVPQALVV